MTIAPTAPSLLERLRLPNQNDAWQRFVDVNMPLFRFWTRRLGLQEQDAADLIQEVLTTLLEKLPTLELRAHGGFHAWLRTVTRNKWIDLQRKNRLSRQTEVDSAALDALTSRAEEFWEVDYRRYLIKRALDVMQADFEPATWKACWEVVACRRPAAEVADELGLTAGAVHAARFRVLTRLREEFGPMMD